MRRWWLAALLSILAPGLGQVYNGQIRKGAYFYFGLYAASSTAAIWLILEHPSSLVFLLLLAVFALLVLGIIGDAIRTARKIGDRFVPKSYNRIPVYLVIIIVSSLVSTAVGEATKAYLIQAYRISSASMEPTLLVGDYIFIRKHFAEIHRGDIVVYEFPEDPSRDFIQRVVGLPGETIEIQKKMVFINGQPLEESYVSFSDVEDLDARLSAGTTPANIIRTRDNMPQILVPAGKLFVMGDNRDRSYDSRFWGFVDRSEVKGMAYTIYFSRDERMKIRWSRIGMLLGVDQSPPKCKISLIKSLNWSPVF